MKGKGSGRKICENKRKFKSVRAAHKSLNRLNETSKRESVPHRTYYCELCNHWHLSSKSYESDS